MGSSFPASGFGAGGRSEGVWQMVEQMRSSFEKRTGSRVGRGDVRAAALALLAEQPMHGHQIMSEIEHRSGGQWKPSAGEVYPTLQLLADEGLVSAGESSGRRTYTLTEAAREEAARAAASAPWESTGADAGATCSALPRAGFELAQAAAQLGRTGTPDQIKQAVVVLDAARRELYSILAQD